MLILRTIAGLMLILMGFAWRVGGWCLTRFERVGQPVECPKTHHQQFYELDKLHHQLMLGMLWGFLPCGLIYSSLTWVAANGQPLSGMATMAAFV